LLNSTLTSRTYPPRRWRGGYAEWVQIVLILYRVELEKSLHETEDYLNEMPDALAVFGFDKAPITVCSVSGDSNTGCVNSAACSHSPDVSGRGIAVVTGTTEPDIIAVTFQQPL